VAISTPDVLTLLSPPLTIPMDYSIGVLNTMCAPFFPKLRGDLGPYLVDKTELIESIVVNNCLTGDVNLVLRPRRCGKSTMLQMLK
jgi:Predicted AAA-ATPase